jgi:hypothetical protein
MWMGWLCGVAQVEAKLLHARWYPLTGAGIIKNSSSPLGEFMKKKQFFCYKEYLFSFDFFNDSYRFFQQFPKSIL